MFDIALAFIADEVNAHIKKRTGGVGNAVETGPIADDSGKWAVTDLQLRLALVNIEEDRVAREQVPQRRRIDGRDVIVAPGVKLNLVVLFAARLKNYGDSLRYLAHVMAFFQAHPLFTAEEYPGLDRRIERLSADLLSYGPDQLNQLWAYIGTKYLPSVVYRIRMVTLQDDEPQGVALPITTIDTALHGT